MFKPRRGGRGFDIWSFVGSKNNKQWLWLAIDIETKEIVGFFLGERREKGAWGLWNSLPGVYRTHLRSFSRKQDLRKNTIYNSSSQPW